MVEITRRILAPLSAIMLALSGCGDTRLERAGSGAVTGSAIGYGVGFVSGPGENTATGLFVGMAIGALIGALLDEPLFMNYHNN